MSDAFNFDFLNSNDQTALKQDRAEAFDLLNSDATVASNQFGQASMLPTLPVITEATGFIPATLSLPGPPRPQRLRQAFAAVIIGLGVVVGLVGFFLIKDQLDALSPAGWRSYLASFGLMEHTDGNGNPAAKPLLQEKSQQQQKVVETVPGNPYWHLANGVDGKIAKIERLWVPREEELWRKDLKDPRQYRAFKAVMETRELRLRGSEAILWEALGDGKLWVRMQALIGLVEFGIEVDMATVEVVLQERREPLVSNFFKRFRENPSVAELYVLRQSIRLVPESARYQILQALSAAKDRFFPLYVVAALEDPSTKVAAAARSMLTEVSLPLQTFATMQRVVSGQEVFAAVAPDAVQEAPAAKPSGSEELTLPEEITIFSPEESFLDEDVLTPGADGFEDIEVFEISDEI